MILQKSHEIDLPNQFLLCSLIDLRNDIISRGKYTDIVDELIIKFTKAKDKKIKIKEV